MSNITPSISTDSPSAKTIEVRSEAGGIGVKWRLLPGWRQAITGQESPDWFNLIESGTAQRVKMGQGREVWRVDLGEEVVYAKITSSTRWLDRMKTMFAGSSAEREWRALLSATNRGVPVVQALAVGKQARGTRRSVLITHEFRGANDLKQSWLTLLSRPTAQSSAIDAHELVVRLADFIADSHKKGFVHRDLHPANVLVSSPEGEKNEFRFVDLLGGRTERCEVGLSAAVHSLSQLYQFFGRNSSKTMRLRFLRAYLLCRNEAGEENSGRQVRRRWVELVSNQAAIIAASLSRQRDKRLHRHGKYFAPWRKRGGWQGVSTLVLERRHIFPESSVQDRSLQNWSEVLDDILPKLTRVNESEGSLVAAGLVWDYRRATGLMERLRWTWLGSPAKMAFMENHRRRHRGENAPLVLGYFHRARLIDLCVSVQPAD